MGITPPEPRALQAKKAFNRYSCFPVSQTTHKKKSFDNSPAFLTGRISITDNSPYEVDAETAEMWSSLPDEKKTRGRKLRRNSLLQVLQKFDSRDFTETTTRRSPIVTRLEVRTSGVAVSMERRRSGKAILISVLRLDVVRKKEE